MKEKGSDPGLTPVVKQPRFRAPVLWLPGHNFVILAVWFSGTQRLNIIQFNNLAAVIQTPWEWQTVC